MLQVAIGDRQPDFAAMVLEVIAEGFGNGEDGLFPGGFVGLPGRKGKRVYELHAEGVFD